MKFDFRDPANIIAIVIILFGLFFLIWALGKLFKKPAELDDPFLASDPNFGPPLDNFDREPALTPSVPTTADYPEPEPIQQAPMPSSAGTTVIKPNLSADATPPNKEMVERLDTMSQRLNDMQTVLQRQATSGPAGTPLTPETIDKLLKIISNVTQQVDLLQRSLGSSASASGSTPSPAPHPATPPATPKSSSVPPPAAPPAAKPTASPSATPNVPTAGAPQPKTIGVNGGALSALPKTGATAAPAPANPTATPPPTNK
jgi:hypothetical protein